MKNVSLSLAFAGALLVSSQTGAFGLFGLASHEAGKYKACKENQFEGAACQRSRGYKSLLSKWHNKMAKIDAVEKERQKNANDK